MKSIRKLSTFLAGGMLALLLAVGAGSAFADTPVVDSVLSIAQTEGEDAGTPPEDDATEGERQGRRGGCSNELLADYLSQDDLNNAVADALGISVAELEAAQEEGTKSSELAEELGVPIEDVQAAKLGVTEVAVAAALADEAITQEQADHILERAANGRRGGNRGGRTAPPADANNA